MVNIKSSIKVNQADVKLVWNPQSFDYGRALTVSDLNAKAYDIKSKELSGTFEYVREGTSDKVQVGDVLDADTYEITATFSATKSSNYING